MSDAAALGLEWTNDMATIAAKCGDDVALALAQAYPGLRIYIPQKWVEGGMLGFIGREVGEHLCAAMGGGAIYVSAKKRRQDGLGAAVRELDQAGLTTNEIALQLGVSENWVRRLRKKVGSKSRKPRGHDPRQMSWIEESDDT